MVEGYMETRGGIGKRWDVRVVRWEMGRGRGGGRRMIEVAVGEMQRGVG